MISRTSCTRSSSKFEVSVLLIMTISTPNCSHRENINSEPNRSKRSLCVIPIAENKCTFERVKAPRFDDLEFGLIKPLLVVLEGNGFLPKLSSFEHKGL